MFEFEDIMMAVFWLVWAQCIAFLLDTYIIDWVLSFFKRETVQIQLDNEII